MQAFAVLLLTVHLYMVQTEGWFLDHPWGTPVARMRSRYDLHVTTQTEERATYSSNIRQLGDVDLDECNLEFVDNRFSGVIIMTRGWTNAHRLLKYLRQSFGDGTSAEPPAVSWIVGDTRISYDIDSYGDAYVYWYSLTHQDQ